MKQIKKMSNKIAKILLLITVIISDLITPIEVFASELSSRNTPNKGDIGINNEVINNGENATIYSGNYETDEALVTKKVTKIDANNGIYNVELKVKGKDKTSTTQVIKPIYVVIVFDTSGSMICDSSEGGYSYTTTDGSDEEVHYTAADGTKIVCKSNGGYYYKKDTLTKDKWESAVNGAVKFSEDLTKIANTNIALVTFASTANNAVPTNGWNDSAFTASDFSHPNGGTSLAEGLSKAISKLDDVTEENAQKFIIVMSDGEPNDNPIPNAYEAKNKNGITIYSIGYGVTSGGDAEKVLKRISSNTTITKETHSSFYGGTRTEYSFKEDKEGFYLAASTEGITNSFKTIFDDLARSNAASDAVLTDIIGDNFNYVSGTASSNDISVSGKNVTINVGDVTETEKTYSFNIQIADPDSPTGWYRTNGNATNNSFTLTGIGLTNQITSSESAEVYWVQNTYDYVINYYKDSISSSNYLGTSDTRQASKNTNIVLNDTDKNAYLATAGEGYELNSVNPSTLVISTDSSKNVINVLYTKKKLTYKVEYLFEELDGSYTELSSVPSKNNISATYGDEVNALTYNNITIPSGYTFNESKTKGSNSGIYTIKNNEVVIKLYYDREKLNYNVVYKFENINENGYEERPDLVSNKNNITVKYGTEVTATEHLLSTIPNGFELNKTKTYEVNNGKYTINTNNKTIYIYYDRGNYRFIVKYYFNGEFDNIYSYSNDAIYGATKKASDYTLDKVNNAHLTDKISSDNKDYFLDPTKNNDSITIGTTSNELNVYYISTEFVPTANRIEEITKTNNINIITSSSNKVTYTIKYKLNSNIKNIKSGDKVLFTVVDTLPGSIDTTNSSLNGGSYDSTNNTITWTYEENISEFTSLYNVNNKEITITYTVLYNDYLSSNGSKMTNTVTGKTEIVRGNDTVITTNGVSASSDVNVNITSSVTASYIIEGTTTKLCDDVTTTGLVGTGYTTEKKTFFGYEFKTTTGDSPADNYVEGKNFAVTYVYTKNDGNVESINVGKTGPDTINSINGVFEYTISGSAIIKDYVGDVTLTVKDTLPYTIDVSKSTIPSRCKYDESTKTITCSIKHENIKERDYILGEFSISASFNLKLVFNGIDKAEVINKAQTIVDLNGNKTPSNEVEKKTEVLKGNLIVEHRSDSEVLETEDTKTALAGTSYTTNSKSYYGYTLDTTRMPSNANREYKANETITVTYYYTKNVGTVTDNVSKEQKNTITDINSKYHYVLSYTGEVNDYVGEVKLELTDTLPYNASISNIDNRCTVSGKTIVCSETYNITENNKQISATFNIELTYTNVGAEVTNSVKSKLIYGNSTSTKETTVTDNIPYGKLIVKHVSGDTILETETTKTELSGTTYETSNKTFFGYTYDGNKPSNANGQYKANETIEVVYNYTKNDGEIDEPNTEKTGPNTVNSIDGIFNYNINATGNIKNYVGDITLIVKDILPYTIDESKSNLDNRCSYDESTKTITCTEEYTNITEKDYTNGVYKINETFNLQLVFIGIDSDTVINKASSTIKLEKVEQTTNTETDTTIEKGKLIVIHMNEDNEILETEATKTDLAGVGYETTHKDTFHGYTYNKNKKPANANGVYIANETINVIYYYSKNIGNAEEDLVKHGPENVDGINSEFNYTISYNTYISDYVGKAKITIIDILPYEIDLEKSEFNDKCTYKNGKITCNYEFDITKNERISINENLKLYYKGINSEEVTNKVESILTYGEIVKNNNETTTIVKKGNIIANYVTIVNGEYQKLTDSIKTSGLVGTTYKTIEKEFTGYTLTSIEGKEEGTYSEEDQEVTYIYELKKLPPKTGVEVNPTYNINFLSSLLVLLIGLVLRKKI